jgi:hypothetical protein
MNLDFHNESKDLVGRAFFNLFLTYSKQNQHHSNSHLPLHKVVKPVTLLFHNLGKFDGLFILKGMFNGGLDKMRQYVLLKYNGKYTITMVPRIRNRIIYQIQIKYKRKSVKNKRKMSI